MAVLTARTGYDVKYLTDEVAAGREAYYLDAAAEGEPPGLWFGRGAAALGLSGEVDGEMMEAVYSELLDPRHEATANRATWGQAPRFAKGHNRYRTPEDIYQGLLAAEAGAGPERRDQLRAQAEAKAKTPVKFVDLTFSAPKSVSVLAVAFQRESVAARRRGDPVTADLYAGYHKAVEDAVLAGAQASVQHLETVAGYARTGHHGGKAGRWIDAHEWVAASFLQHDSRNHDPQLHVHNPALNRVRCTDGVWRALDTQLIKMHRPAAAAIGERVMEAYLYDTVPLRLIARTDDAGREIEGVAREVMDTFSSRSHAINKVKQREVDEWCERHGRDMTPLQRSRMAQRATLETRAAKSHTGETTDERMQRWAAQAEAEREGGLTEIARDVLRLGEDRVQAEQWSPQDVKARALAAVQNERSGWHEADLAWQVSQALPANLGIRPEQVRPLIEGLTAEIMSEVVALGPKEDASHLPDELKLDNGESSFARPGAQTYAAPGHIAAERALREAAVERGAVTFSADEANAALAGLAARGVELADDQAGIVRGMMTSGARIEVLSAPAGTGKSYTLGALNGAWAHTQRRVFGLASWQTATEVLAEEGLAAQNVARWLATQRRLEAAPGRAGDDDQWRLQCGDLVVVDEAGAVPTPDLEEVRQRCAEAGAKVLLTGDPRQLGAVGPGGALADLADRAVHYRLGEVRRFRNDWEGRASLRLRDADPDALSEYAKHGRVVEGGTAEEAEQRAGQAWLADTLAGRESLVVVPTNDAAARMCSELRAELVALGRVEPGGVVLGKDGNTAGVGDLIQARKLDWSLIGYQGNTAAPINRRSYRVLERHDDGSLVVAPVTGREDGREQLGDRLTLPRDYVAEHVALGYASTVHAAQGRTVDTCHAIPDTHTDARGLYVAMTRGRDGNTVYPVTRDLPDGADAATRADEAAVITDGVAVEEANTERRSALNVLLGALRRTEDEQQTTALRQQETAEEDARSMERLDRLSDVIQTVNTGRTITLLDQLTEDGTLTDQQRAALAADENTRWIDHALRRAEIAGAQPEDVLREAINGKSLDGSTSAGWVLFDRIDRYLRSDKAPRTELSSYADLVPAGLPERYRAMADDLTEQADERRRELGSRAAAEAPGWALAALGAVPDDVIEREEWEHRAGWIAAYRELTGHDHLQRAVGDAPGAFQTEHFAAWSAAAAAVVNEPAPTAEQAMSEGQLSVRVHAMEREKQWAPRWVNDELGAVCREQDDARHSAEIARARGKATQDADERTQLLAEANAATERHQQLTEHRAELEMADEGRAAWHAHTEQTRAAAKRAQDELTVRGFPVDDPQDRVTAQEWLDAHLADQAAEDPVRPVTETDIAADEFPDHQTAEEAATAETDIADLREASARDELEDSDDDRRERVPTSEETRATLARLRAAQAEMAARQAQEAAEAERVFAITAEEAQRREETDQRTRDLAAADEAAAADQDSQHAEVG